MCLKSTENNFNKDELGLFLPLEERSLEILKDLIRRRGRTNAYALLGLAKHSLSSNPRDKIYGMRGLAEELCRHSHFATIGSRFPLELGLLPVYPDIEIYNLSSYFNCVPDSRKFAVHNN